MRDRLIAVALTTVFLLPAAASAYSLLGGKTLGVRHSALAVKLGYPELDVTYHIPILKNFEIAPRFTLHYAQGFAGGGEAPGVVGNTFGAEIRWMMVNKERFHLSLFADPALYVTYVGVGSTVFGVRLGIPGGVRLDFDITQEVNIVAGANIPILLNVEPGFAFILPINTMVGTEISLTKEVNLSVLLEAGPAVISAGGTSFIGLSVRAMIGVEYLL